MPWLVRLVFWYFCVEWMLALRIWYAPKVILPLLALLGLRLFTLHMVLPTWQFYAAFCSGMIFVGSMHLCDALSRRGRVRRDALGLDGFGVPWLQLVTRNWKAAVYFAEPLCAGVAFYLLAERPDAVLLHAGRSAQARGIATFQPLISLAVLMLYTAWEYSGLNIRLPKRQKAASSFPLVEEHRHVTPSLPSVKELADELRSWRGL